jgi:hypothetical protein
VVNAGRASIETNIVSMPEIPILNAIGTPKTSSDIKLTTNTITPKYSILNHLFGFRLRF